MHHSEYDPSLRAHCSTRRLACCSRSVWLRPTSTLLEGAFPASWCLSLIPGSSLPWARPTSTAVSPSRSPKANGRSMSASSEDSGRRGSNLPSHGGGEEVRLLPEGRTHSGGLVFAPDGRTLAVGNCGRVIRLLDAGKGRDRAALRSHQGSVTALATDGRTVFTATDEGAIHRWDARTGRELGRLLGHKCGAQGGEAWSIGRFRQPLLGVGHELCCLLQLGF